MATIYRLASRVVVWLGPANASDEEVFNALFLVAESGSLTKAAPIHDTTDAEWTAAKGELTPLEHAALSSSNGRGLSECGYVPPLHTGSKQFLLWPAIPPRSLFGREK